MSNESEQRTTEQLCGKAHSYKVGQCLACEVERLNSELTQWKSGGSTGQIAQWRYKAEQSDRLMAALRDLVDVAPRNVSSERVCSAFAVARALLTTYASPVWESPDE